LTKPKKDFQARVQVPGDRWAPTAEVLARYSVGPSTIARWHGNPALGFPTPIQITPGGPNLYSVQELDLFDQRRAEQTLQERPQRSELARVRRLKVLEAKSALNAASAHGDNVTMKAEAERDTPARQKPRARGPLTRPAGVPPAREQPPERSP